MRAVSRRAVAEWIPTLKITVFLHQVGEKNALKKASGSSLHTNTCTDSGVTLCVCVWCSRTSFLNAMVSVYVHECVCVCFLPPVTAQMAVEIWMHGVTAWLSYLQCLCSLCLITMSCDRGIQGEWSGFSPLLLPLIVCHPKLIGSRTLTDRADHWDGTQLDSARRSPSKCCNWVKSQSYITEGFNVLDLHLQQLLPVRSIPIHL